MGYYKRLGNHAFVVDKEGVTHFFPYGVFAKGYIMHDAEQEEKIRKSLGWYYLCTFLPMILIGASVGWLFGIIVIPFAALLWIIMVRKLTLGLEISSMKLTFIENCKRLLGKDYS